MGSRDRQVQPIDKRGAALALVAAALAALFEVLIYASPELLERPLSEGSSLTVALLFAFFSFLIPVIIAWLICRKDPPSLPQTRSGS